MRRVIRRIVARRLHALRLCALGLWCAWTPVSHAQAIAGASEIEIKAAMLYRAAKFIEWPKQAFLDDTAPFIVCVVGDSVALQAFEPLQGRTLNGRNVVARRVTGDAIDLHQCHAVFFTREHVKDSDYAIDKLRGLPILTVGEAHDFAARGGMLALLTRDQRVGLTFNLTVSKRAGLTVSSQLLKLSTVVGAVDSP